MSFSYQWFFRNFIFQITCKQDQPQEKGTHLRQQNSWGATKCPKSCYFTPKSLKIRTSYCSSENNTVTPDQQLPHKELVPLSRTGCQSILPHLMYISSTATKVSGCSAVVAVPHIHAGWSWYPSPRRGWLWLLPTTTLRKEMCLSVWLYLPHVGMHKLEDRNKAELL